MARALGEYKVSGVRTTIPVLRQIMADPDFVAGRLSTHFLDRLQSAARPQAEGRRRPVALIAAALAAYEGAGRSVLTSVKPSPWAMSTRRAGWRKPS